MDDNESTIHPSMEDTPIDAALLTRSFVKHIRTETEKVAYAADIRSCDVELNDDSIRWCFYRTILDFIVPINDDFIVELRLIADQFADAMRDQWHHLNYVPSNVESMFNKLFKRIEHLLAYQNFRPYIATQPFFTLGSFAEILADGHHEVSTREVHQSPVPDDPPADTEPQTLRQACKTTYDLASAHACEKMGQVAETCGDPQVAIGNIENVLQLMRDIRRFQESLTD